MKKGLLFILVLLTVSVGKTFAQSGSSSDTAKIVQAIIDIPELQKYYPVNSDNTLKQINVVQNPVSFSNSLEVTKGGQSLNLIPASEHQNFTGDGYFTFRSLGTDLNAPNVRLNFFYKPNGATAYKTLFINVGLQKNNGNYTISTYTLNGDTL